MPFIRLKVPFNSGLLGDFFLNEWLLINFFSNGFPESIWVSLFLLFILLIWLITLIGIAYVKPSWESKDTPNMSWFCFLYCWILFANILLRIFVSVFIKDIGLKLKNFFTGFVIGVTLVSQNELESVLFHFLIFSKMKVNSFLIKFTMWSLLCGKVFYVDVSEGF